MAESTQLPAILDAQLPKSYENACAALARCSKIDECKQWADKAGALASYARQSEDRSLQDYAVRIRARAVRRAGQLLKQIAPQAGQRTDKPMADTDPKSRKKAAREAGMSSRQQKTAIRVANVSDKDFETAVQSDTPPSISKLESWGRKFTLTQVVEARLHVTLERVLKSLDTFIDGLNWKELKGLDGGLADRAERHSKALLEVAKCIRSKT